MNIKELRKQLDLTQTELASKIGVSQPTINRIENGKQELSKTIELAIRYFSENRNKQLKK